MSVANCGECGDQVDTDVEGIYCWQCGGLLCEECQSLENCPICGATADETDEQENTNE